MRYKDLSGKSYNNLTAVEFVYTKNTNAHWKCLCACGAETIVSACALQRGDTKSCGCLVPISNKKHKLKHGYALASDKSNRTYKSWCHMKYRCLNPSSNIYRYYGGRGVTVCERWLHSFENFLADMGERPEGMTLDRINPYGNYEPTNCRWSTPLEQARNTRNHYDKT